MRSLLVDPHGLSTFAASCVERAITLRGALAADHSAGPGFQATSHAVTASDSKVGAAGETLATRIDDLASKLSAAADAYRGRDRESATALHRAIDEVPA